jgi:hypothetical protein
MYINSNGLYLPDSTLLVSSQFTTSIHWPYNCTIRVYACATLLVSSQFTTSIHWPYNCTIRVYAGATLLVSSQFTTSIHWPYNCTIRVFVVNHFCDGVWSLLVEANLCRVSLSIGYICISVGDPVIKMGGLGSH